MSEYTLFTPLTGPDILQFQTWAVANTGTVRVRVLRPDGSLMLTFTFDADTLTPADMLDRIGAELAIAPTTGSVN